MLVHRKTKGCLFLLLVGAVGLAGFLGFFHPRGIEEGEKVQPIVVMSDQRLEELSGLVASRKYPGVLWAHPDSGNEPRLHALEINGNSTTIELEDVNLCDWEAIASCGDKLYITEMGNNLNASKNLGVYEFTEPDPKTTKTLKPERFIPVRYPDQQHFPARDRWHFDCEAAFCFQGSLYFVTKNRPAFRLFVQEGGANLYRLDMTGLSEDNILERIDSIDGLGGWVTAADISADEEWLAILIESPQQSIWLFQRPVSGDRFFSEPRSVKRFKFYRGGQLESLAFVQHNGVESLVMLNEDRELFRIGLQKFSAF